MPTPKADKRHPWLKWYTQAWRADVPLRMCSYAARGLWADLLTLMHESTAYGFLLVEGVNPTSKQLAGLLGGSDREVKALLQELGEANVYSVTGRPMPEDVEALVPSDMPAGVILSRRMLRDKAKAERDRRNGGSGGNPSLNQKDKPVVNGPLKAGVNPPLNAQKIEVKGEAPLGLPPSEEHRTSSPIAAREGQEGPAHAAGAQILINRAAAARRVGP